MDDCGEIIVRGSRQKDEILLTVTDNGMGIPEEEVEFLLTDTKRVHKKGSGAVSYTHLTKKVWLNIYNASDNFLSSTYQPLLQKYDDLLNLDVEYIGGDGQTESNVTNRLGNPSQYDAFAINMVKTDNAASYTAILNQ